MDRAERQALDTGNGAGQGTDSVGIPQVLGLATLGAWLLVLGSALSGTSGLLHHDALLSGLGTLGGSPSWLTIGLGLGAWQLMVLAMMLPGSLPAFEAFERQSRLLAHRSAGLLAFVGAYLVGWAIVGLLLLAGDAALHGLVDAAAMAWPTLVVDPGRRGGRRGRV